jgi:hypothetical protein
VYVFDCMFDCMLLSVRSATLYILTIDTENAVDANSRCVDGDRLGRCDVDECCGSENHEGSYTVVVHGYFHIGYRIVPISFKRRWHIIVIP